MKMQEKNRELEFGVEMNLFTLNFEKLKWS